MKKIGFFGGCFNPPTNIHIKIAKDLIDEGKLDKVIFIPVNDYYKKDNLIPALHRLKMLKLIANKYNDLEVDDIEIKQNRQLYAADAFKLIEDRVYLENHEKNKIFMIMGSDNYDKMSLWKDYETIKNRYKYIVIQRDENEISSTKIREMIKNKNKKVIEYLPKEVYEYIIKNKLYEEN